MQIRKPVLFVPSLFFFAASCTLLIAPDDDNDGVSRCATNSDCPLLSNHHYSYECVRGDEQGENSPKVCAPAFSRVKCNPESYEKDSQYAKLFEEAKESVAYRNKCEDKLGQEGCPPKEGACDPGLEKNPVGTCIDPNADYRPIRLIEGGEDVKHQFCSWFFCSDEFVCGSAGFCTLCDPDAELDEEGNNSGNACAKYFVGAAPSPIYLGDGQCNKDGKYKTDQAATEANFGELPQ